MCIFRHHNHTIHGLSQKEVARIIEEFNSTARGDAFEICQTNHGCYHSRDGVLRMQAEAPDLAWKYTAIILGCYVVGLIVLLLHFIKQKHGQISCHDLYLEICPSRFTGLELDDKPQMIEDGEDDENEEAMEAAGDLEFGDDDETVMKIVRDPPIMMLPHNETRRSSPMAKIRNGKCVRMMSKVSELEEENAEHNDDDDQDDSNDSAASNGGCSSFSERPQTTLAETSL